VILYFLGRIASFVFGKLPPRQGYALACVLGHIVYLTWPRGRTYLRENMGYVLGNGASQKQIDRLAKGSLRNYFRYLADFVCLPAVKPEDIKKRVIFQGWDNLEGALGEGKGAILVSLHQGNWDLSGAAIALRNYPLNVVAESFPSAKLNEFVQRRRREKGMKVIPMEHGVGRMVQALRRNELLALLIDIPGADKGVAVNFFDAITQVPRGAATLALKTDAKVIPTSLVRLPDNTFVAFIGQYIPFQPSGDLKKDIQALTQSIMSSLEKFVRQYPDQWYMFRRMWLKEARDSG